MIQHHEGGIAVVRIQLKHGKDPEMSQGAEKLIKDQGKEMKNTKLG